MKPYMMTCFTCGLPFQFGPHKYDGKHLPAYQFTVCRGCYSSNWDGWAPAYQDKIVAHMETKGLPLPKRNAAGWLPVDG